MHICLVHRDLHEPARGGICTLYRALAERLVTRGHRVTLLTQDTTDPVTLRSVAVISLPRINDLDAHRASVAEALCALRPDIVECSTWEAETLHYLRREDRAPVLVRGDLSAETMGAYDLAPAERLLLSRADQVVTVSDFASRDLSAAYRIDTPPVIPNGVDHRRFRPGSVKAPTTGHRITLDTRGRITSRTPIPDLLAGGASMPPWTAPDHRPRLIWLGKITPMKGWDRLENIAVAMRGYAQLTVVLGHAPAFCAVHPERLDGVTILQGLADHDLPYLYRAADWLLSTSRWEGFGLAIAEALACGTPVLLPDDLGTACELLAAGGGLVYREATDLLGAIGRTPPEGRLHSRFDWDANTDATIRAYQALIASPHVERSCASS